MKLTATHRNLISNIATLAINLGIGFVYTPYLLRHLGVVAYGLIPLALIINQYVNVLTLSLTNSFSRFYTVHVQRQEWDKASQSLTSSAAAMLAVMIVLAPALALFIANVEDFFSIPPQLVQPARILYTLTCCGLYISLATSLLNITLYSINRLDLINLTRNVRNVSSYALIVLLFTLRGPGVVLYGVAWTITETLVLLLSMAFWLRFKDKRVRLAPKHFSKAMLAPILALAIWTIVQKMGDMLLFRVDNILVNVFRGLEESGRLGAISELGTYIIGASAVLSSLFGPLILRDYAQGAHDALCHKVKVYVPYLGMLCALLCGSLSGLGAHFLNFWLGDGMQQFSPWLAIKLFAVPFMIIGGIYSLVVVAWKKVSTTALWTLGLGAVCTAAAALLLKLGGQSMPLTILLALITAFCVAQSYCLCTVIIARTYPGYRFAFAASFAAICICYAASMGAGSLLGRALPPQSLAAACAEVAACAAACCAALMLLRRSDTLTIIKQILHR